MLSKRNAQRRTDFLWAKVDHNRNQIICYRLMVTRLLQRVGCFRWKFSKLQYTEKH